MKTIHIDGTFLLLPKGVKKPCRSIMVNVPSLGDQLWPRVVDYENTFTPLARHSYFAVYLSMFSISCARCTSFELLKITKHKDARWNKQTRQKRKNSIEKLTRSAGRHYSRQT